MKEVTMLICLRFIVTSLFFCFILSGCSHKPQLASIASIEPSPDWHIKVDCGYEHCYPLVDFLVSKDLRVRVEPGFSYKDGICVINVTFITPEHLKYTFTPSSSRLNLSNGTTIISHDFTCSYTIYSAKTFKSSNYLQNPIKLDGHVYEQLRYDCFKLYFDTSPPTVEETFTLNILGLEKDGTQVTIPLINFSKGMR